MQFSQTPESQMRFIPLTQRRRLPRSSFDPMMGHNLALEHLSSMDTVPAMLTDGQEQLPYHTVPGAASVAVPVNAQRSAMRPAAFPNTLERKRRPVGVRRVR